MNKTSSQVVGNIGMYWACYQLSRLGWNCMPTSRNARGVDIIAYNFDCSRMISVQVKSLSKKSPVPLGKTLERIMGDFWLIVNNVVGDPTTYIMLPEEIKNLAHRGEKEGRISYWLQPKAYAIEEYLEAWHRIEKPAL